MTLVGGAAAAWRHSTTKNAHRVPNRTHP